MFFTKLKTYDSPQENINTTPISPSISTQFTKIHPLSLVQQSYRKLLLFIERILHSSNLQRSPISHIALQPPTIVDTYEQIDEQPHTRKFRSHNNHLFSPR